MTAKNYNDCVTSYADNVYRFIYKNLGHEEDAKDIIQQSFEKLWIHREEVEEEKAKSYLFTVAYRCMIDHIRKSKRMVFGQEMAESNSATEQNPFATKRILEESLATLNEQQRVLVMLKDYEGYSYEEIGTITGLNPSQVKVYLHRARLSMRNYIVKYENIL